MSRPLWLVSLLKLSFPTRFLVARLSKAPVIGGLLDRWFFAGDDLFYLPKDRVIPVNRSLDLPADLVLPSQVVDDFIATANYHWIMNVCLCRDASKCQDYPIDLGCLFLGQAAQGINPKLGRRVSKEEALAHVRRCREAGLVHLVGRNKLDTVWLGVGPGDRLLTICNCCPCCCLWRVLPDITPEIGHKVARMPGVRVAVSDSCIGCGLCVPDVCFVHAIRMEGDVAVIGEACRGCGRCVEVCPQQAIALSIDDTQFVERSIHRLSALVDVS